MSQVACIPVIELENPLFVIHSRQVFSPALIKEFREYIAGLETNQQAQTEREKTAVRQGVGSDALRMDSRWFDLWRDPNLLSLVSPYTWIAYPPQVRMVRKAEHLVPWHQDIAYQRLLGARGHDEVITCWVPLDEEPIKHATLQFAHAEVQEIEHVPMGNFGAGLSQQEFSQVRHYELETGDCLLFGCLAVHRTFVPPGARIERQSLEFRLLRPDVARDNKDYFDIESGEFVTKEKA